MTVSRPAMIAFNRGLLSPKALARVDLNRTQLSAEIQKNWMPRVLGSMALRPGLQFNGDGGSALTPDTPASSQKGTITGWINPVGMKDEITDTLCAGNQIVFTSNFENMADVAGSLAIYFQNQGRDSPGSEFILPGKVNIVFTFTDLICANGTDFVQFLVASGDFNNATATYIDMPEDGFGVAFNYDFSNGADWHAEIHLTKSDGTVIDISNFYVVQKNAAPATHANHVNIGSPLHPDFSFFRSSTNHNFGGNRILYFNFGSDEASEETFPPPDPMTNLDMWDSAEFCQWWFGFGQAIDMTGLTGMRKFYDDASTPIKWAPKDLGSAGQNPTGSAPPYLFRRGLLATFPNDGTDGGALALYERTTRDGVTPTAPADASTIPATSTAHQSLGVRFGINNGAITRLPETVLQSVSTSSSGQKAVYLPFIRGAKDTALLEFTGLKFRPWVVDTDGRSAALVTRASVASQLVNGDFIAGSLAGWTTADEAGAATIYDTLDGLPCAKLTGTGFNRAIINQTVTVASGDQNVRHALRIVVSRGTVTFRCGSTVGGDDYVRETILGTGVHSLAFTPTGDFTAWFASDLDYSVFFHSCLVEAAGILELPADFRQEDVGMIRWGQSVDVVFLATASYQQHKVERRAVDSWSLVLFEPLDGPFKVQNVTPITLTPSALKGDITVTSSRDLFRDGHFGALFRIRSIGQTVDQTLAGEDQWSDPVEVAGVGQGRNILVNITSLSGTGSTVRLQQSVGAIGAWEDVTAGTSSWTTDQTNTVFNDTFDNDLIFYRIGIKTGEYVAGTIDATLFVPAGGINGIVKITHVTDPKTVSAVVVKTLGGLLASDTWWEGLWSVESGFPSAVDEPYEGRLCWAGSDFIVQSVSDAYASYDDTIEGDSAPIIRSIGTGPVDTVGWLLGLQRLLMGGDCRAYSIRSSSLDEPLTPSNWNLKIASTQGSKRVPAVKLESDAIYVQVSEQRIFRLSFNPSYFSGIDYSATDLTKICPEVGKAGFARIAVQLQPDVRIHCVRDDGTAAVLVFDPLEKVQAWIEVETDGFIEDVVVLPGVEEDLVFYGILRQPGDYSAQHDLEIWAMESECKGPYSNDPDLNKQADCFIVFDVGGGEPVTRITGIPSFFNGQEVVCWGDGRDLGGVERNTFTVVASGINVPVAVSKAIVGLWYQGTYKSTKIAYGGMNGNTALTMRKQVKTLGLIAGVLHAQGLQFGPDFDTLDDLPGIEEAAPVDFDFVWAEYDHDPIEFPGEMNPDSRICLVAQAPRPAEVLGLVPGVDTADVV